MSTTHVAKLLPDRAPEGFVETVFPSPDLWRCAFSVEDRGSAWRAGPKRMMFDGRTVCSDEAYVGIYNPQAALSYDGTRFATAQQVLVPLAHGNGSEPVYDVRINGESVYQVPFDTLTNLVWLDNKRLAWMCWDRDRLDDETKCPECSAALPSCRGSRESRSSRITRPRGIRAYVQGVDVTGKIAFEPLMLDWMKEAIQVSEDGKAYLIYEDGTRSDPVPMPEGERLSTVLEDLTRNKLANVTGSEPIARQALGRHGLTGTVVIKSGRVAEAVSGFVERAFNRAEKSVEDAQGRQWTTTSLWAWPLAVVFNPYFGPGHFALKFAERYIPMVNNVPWDRTYQAVMPDFFFTPEGRFVITGYERRGWTVVIDGVPGPTWHEIVRTRYFPGEGVVYLARRGREFYRVTVKVS